MTLAEGDAGPEASPEASAAGCWSGVDGAVLGTWRCRAASGVLGDVGGEGDAGVAAAAVAEADADAEGASEGASEMSAEDCWRRRRAAWLLRSSVCSAPSFQRRT